MDEENVDIDTAVFVDMQYPVEKLTFRWRISNFSKIFAIVSTKVSTSSKSATLYFQIDHRQTEKVIGVRLLDGPRCVSINYHAMTKTMVRNVENKGKFYLDSADRYNTAEILRIYTGGCEKTIFEDDVLNFQCTMTIFGHSITRNLFSQNDAHRSSQKINNDFEKLFRSSQHCDVSLFDGKNKIPAHKAVLCARSPVFNIMFQHNMLENTNNIVEIDDIDFEILQDFVLFLYSGKMEQLSWDKAMKLYYTADKYEVLDLRDICSDFLLLHLSTENACDVLKMADQHKDDVLKRGVVFFVQMQISSVKMTQGWKDLTKSCPKLISEFFN